MREQVRVVLRCRHMDEEEYLTGYAVSYRYPHSLAGCLIHALFWPNVHHIALLYAPQPLYKRMARAPTLCHPYYWHRGPSSSRLERTDMSFMSGPALQRVMESTRSLIQVFRSDTPSSGPPVRMLRRCSYPGSGGWIPRWS